MAISSINFQKAKSHSKAHNFREDYVSYLLEEKYQKQNEYCEFFPDRKKVFQSELSKAKRKGGRIPKFENSNWEAVVNLNEEHNIVNLRIVAHMLEHLLNIICTDIALHRDEGYVQKNGKVKYNYHAHLNFITYKDGRQNWRKEHIKPKTLSKIQTMVARYLHMERGKIKSKAIRLEHKQYKYFAQKLEEQKAALKPENDNQEILLKIKTRHLKEKENEILELNKKLKEKEEEYQLLLKKLKEKEEQKTVLPQNQDELIFLRKFYTKITNTELNLDLCSDVDYIAQMAIDGIIELERFKSTMRGDKEQERSINTTKNNPTMREKLK